MIATATVDSIPVRDASGLRFDASITLASRKEPSRFRARVIWSGDPPPVSAGDRWRLLLALHPPRSRVNPYAHDGERHLFRERLHAYARVVPSRLNSRVSRDHRPVAGWRERIARRIDAEVNDRDAAGLITALAVGHTGGMSREQWRVFNVTGTAHLVAISGLHVTLFAIAAIALSRMLWRALARWPVPPRESFAAALGLAAATAYSLLAGFSVPTQRTLIMLGAWFAARAFARHATLSMPIAVALIAVLAIDPFAPLGAGFWLSFLAMSAILLASATRPRRRPLAEALRVQGAVALALAPATLASFGGVSLAGIGVNLVAIPVVSFVFVPLILLAVALMPLAAISGALLGAAAGIYDVLWPWLQASADLRHAMVFASPPIWWLAFAGFAAVIAALPWPARLRIACVAWLLPFVAGGRDVRPESIELTLLDTGRAPAVIVRTAGHVLVHGIGEGFGTNGRSVENAVLPYLRANGVKRIDLLMLGRAGQVPATGVNALLANIEVGRILVAAGSPPFARAHACQGGKRWKPGAVAFSVGGPDCELEVSVGTSRASVFGRSVIVATRDPSGARHEVTLVTGPPDSTASRARDGAGRAPRRLTTATSGAIGLRIGAAGIEQLHEERATGRLWRLPMAE